MRFILYIRKFRINSLVSKFDHAVLYPAQSSQRSECTRDRFVLLVSGLMGEGLGELIEVGKIERHESDNHYNQKCHLITCLLFAFAVG